MTVDAPSPLHAAHSPLMIPGFEETYHAVLRALGVASAGDQAIEPISQLLDASSRAQLVAVVEGSLAGLVEKRAARCLLAAFHEYRTAHGFDLDPTSRRGYDSFLAAESGERLASRVLETYPVLHDHLTAALRLRAAAWTLLTRRLAEDLPELVEHRLVGPEPIVAAFGGAAGDTHNGGQQVSSVRFRDGTELYYKPRGLATDELARRAFDAIGQHLPLDLTGCVPPGLDRGSHGWQRSCERQDIADTEGLERYYRRFGALCAVATALGSSDLHYENVIPAGEHPIVIDTETMLRQGIDWQIGNLPQALTASVSFSPAAAMLLPARSRRSRVDLLMSALGPEHDQTADRRSPVLLDPDTDGMRFSWTDITVNTGSSLPSLMGASTGPFGCLSALRSGFIEAMVGVRSGALTDAVRAAPPASIRFVFRPTFVYARFQDALTHPRYLASVGEAQRLLRLLEPITYFDRDRTERIAELERASLLRGDIPYFAAPSDGHSMFVDGVELGDAFPLTPIEHACRSVTFAADRHDSHHLALIEQCLAEVRPALSRDVGTLIPVAARAQRDGWWRDIASFLLDAAIHDPETGTRAGWLTSTSDASETFPIAASLGFHDVGGMVAFVERCAEQDEAFAAGAQRAALGHDQLVDGVIEDGDTAGHPLVAAPHSVFGGAASLLLARRDVADRWIGQARTVIPHPDGAEPAEVGDLMGGAAGALLVMTSALHRVGGTAALEELGEVLRADLRRAGALERPWFDVAHGELGLLWADARLARTLHDRDRAAAAAALLRTRLRSGPPPTDPAWCKGAAGLLVAGTEIACGAGDHELATRLADQFGDLVAGDPPGDRPVDLSVCHGTSGRVQSLLAVSRWLRDERWGERATALHRRARVVAATHGARTGSAHRAGVLGYMLGWAGIGDTDLAVERWRDGRRRDPYPVELVSRSAPEGWWR